MGGTIVNCLHYTPARKEWSTPIKCAHLDEVVINSVAEIADSLLAFVMVVLSIDIL